MIMVSARIWFLKNGDALTLIGGYFDEKEFTFWSLWAGLAFCFINYVI